MVIIENITDLKTHLHQYINMVSAGEELLLKKGNMPFAKIIPYDRLQQSWKPGQFIANLPDTVDVDAETQREIEEMFYGDGDSEPLIDLK